MAYNRHRVQLDGGLLEFVRELNHRPLLCFVYKVDTAGCAQSIVPIDLGRQDLGGATHLPGSILDRRNLPDCVGAGWRRLCPTDGMAPGQGLVLLWGDGRCSRENTEASADDQPGGHRDELDVLSRLLLHWRLTAVDLVGGHRQTDCL